MGFDNECIINIQSLAGEYFCPVCRLLVLPNETLQAQCTHLYCKPCMAYIANSSKACPYDGYLVTESDAKPLSESNKALADAINKIAVHCLYHRSGCTWQGPLLECITHCSGCAFGNSPVVCNRCAVQIVHRQVQEHAQSCPGVQPQAQPAVQTQEATSANAAATVQSQTVIPAGSVSSQAAPQTSTVTSTQDPKQQPNPSTQGQAVTPGTEQWYQQQYHQYYQQFGGYDAYQQHYQQYYQQQAASQPQLYPQTQVQTQQPQLQTQPPLPANSQAPPQPLASAQSQNQLQPQSQIQQHGQHPLSLQAQTPSQPLNPQQQSQFAVLANQQVHLQNHQSQQYPQVQPQAQSHMSQYPSQSYPQHHAQVPLYQQPQMMQLPQLQPQGHPQQQLQPHSQASQVHASQQLQQQLQLNPALNPLPQSKIQQSQGVTGYQSFPPPQQHLAMQSGGSQQQPVPVRPTQTPQSIQVLGHFPQPSSQILPPQFQQQQGLLPPPSHQSIPPVQQTNFHPTQQAGQVVAQRAVMQSVQQHMAPQVGQQHLGTTHNQFNQRGSSHQLPMHSQILPQGLPHPYQPHQNVLRPNSLQPSHASQKSVGRPLMPTYGVADSFAPNVHGGAQVRPMQPGYNKNNIAGSNNQVRPENNVTKQQANMPKRSAKMDEKPLATDASQKRAGKSESDGKNLGDHKVVLEDDKSRQNEPPGILEQTRTIDGQQASENGEALANQIVKDESAERIGQQLEGYVGKVSADMKDDPTSASTVEENAIVEDKANVDGPPQSTPVQQSDLDGQSRKGSSGLVAQPSSSERNALHHMQQQASGFGHEAGPPSGQVHAGGVVPSSHYGVAALKQRPAASSLLDPTHPGPLHQPNASAKILNRCGPHLVGNPQPGNQVHPPVLKQSHPPPPRMPPTEHLVGGVPPNALDKSGRMMMAHKNPADAFEAGIYPNHRPFHFDGGPSGPNLPLLTGQGLNGQPDFHPNVSMFSQRDGRMTSLRDEWADPSRRGYDRVFDEELKNSSEHVTEFESYLSSGRPFSRGLFDKAVHGPSLNPGDPASSASSRNFPPYDRGNAVGRGPFGPPEANLGKIDSSRMLPEGFSSVYGRHHMDTFAPKSPGREYDGFPLRFPGLHNRYAPDDLARRDLHDLNGPIGSSIPESRFQSLPGPFRKSEFDGNFRTGDMRSGDLMGCDLLPSHIHRGELSGPGRLSNHFRMGEPGGLSSFHERTRPGEPVGPEIYGARIGEPGHKSTFPVPAYSDKATYRGGMEAFDSFRKRRTISMGWCRLCKVDCETVEGLDVHSQTREHQEVAMNMVRSIKQQNAKKQKQSSSNKSSIGDASKTRTTNTGARGNKH